MSCASARSNCNHHHPQNPQPYRPAHAHYVAPAPTRRVGGDQAHVIPDRSLSRKRRKERKSTPTTGDHPRRQPGPQHGPHERMESASGITDAWLPTSPPPTTNPSPPAWADSFYSSPRPPTPDCIATVTHYDLRIAPRRVTPTTGRPRLSPSSSPPASPTSDSRRPRPLRLSFGACSLPSLSGALRTNTRSTAMATKLPPRRGLHVLPLSPSFHLETLSGHFVAAVRWRGRRGREGLRRWRGGSFTQGHEGPAVGEVSCHRRC